MLNAAKLLRIGQATPLAFEFLGFAARRVRRPDLLDLVGEEVDAPGPLAFVLAQALQLAAHRPQPLDELGDLGLLCLQACVAVQQADVLALAQQ